MVKWIVVLIILVVVLKGVAIMWLTHSAHQRIKEHRPPPPSVTWPNEPTPAGRQPTQP